MSLTLTYVTNIDDTSNVSAGSPYTFVGASIGTASADRIVIITAGTEAAAAVAATGVTIGGVNAPIAIQKSAGTGVVSVIAALPVPAGTTATITITFDANTFRCGIGIWTLTGDVSATVTDTDFAIAAPGSGEAITLDIPAGSIAVCTDSHDTGTTTDTWTGAAQRYGYTSESSASFNGADVVATGIDRLGHAVSTTHNSTVASLVGAVWSEAAAPVVTPTLITRSPRYGLTRLARR